MSEPCTCVDGVRLAATPPAPTISVRTAPCRHCALGRTAKAHRRSREWSPSEPLPDWLTAMLTKVELRAQNGAWVRGVPLTAEQATRLEAAGPCRVHRGDDGFTVWPSDGEAGRPRLSSAPDLDTAITEAILEAEARRQPHEIAHLSGLYGHPICWAQDGDSFVVHSPFVTLATAPRLVDAFAAADVEAGLVADFDRGGVVAPTPTP